MKIDSYPPVHAVIVRGDDLGIDLSGVDGIKITGRSLSAGAYRGEDDRRSLLLAIEALASMVRNEYPCGLTLVEIVGTWGEARTPEHLEALRVVEQLPAFA